MKSVLMSAEDYDQYMKIQGLLKKESTTKESGSSVSAIANSTSQTKWIIDSGATDHMTGNSKLISDIHYKQSTHAVTLADGSQAFVQGIGKLRLSSHLLLNSVLYLPKLSFNLISVSQITKDLKCSISFFPDHCEFQDLTTRNIIGRGEACGGLYVFDNVPSKSTSCSSVTSSAIQLHCQLGHPSLPLFKKLCPQFSSLSTLHCESCQYAKHHRVSLYPSVNKRSSSFFEVVHSDIWVPSTVVSKQGYRYFVTFVDDYTRVTWLFLMKSRSELFSIFCVFCAEIQNQFNASIKILRSDNAKEYTSNQFH
jgi:hypothetical protein